MRDAITVAGVIGFIITIVFYILAAMINPTQEMINNFFVWIIPYWITSEISAMIVALILKTT